PPVEGQLGRLRMLAQIPASGDEPLVMLGAGERVNRLGTTQGTVRKAGGANGLGGVFGDVVRYRLGRQRLPGAGQSVSSWTDDPGIDLCPKPQDTPQGRINGRRRRRVAEGRWESPQDGLSQQGGCLAGNDSGGLADGLRQQVGGVLARRRLAVIAGAVQADNCVVVDDATDLVLSNLDEPDPHLLAQLLLGNPEQAGQ